MIEHKIDPSGVVAPSLMASPGAPTVGQGQVGVWHAFSRHRPAVIALVVFLVIALAAVLAPVLPLPDPNAQVLLDRLQGPSAHNLLGTDELGRDQLTRLLFATRTVAVTG